MVLLAGVRMGVASGLEEGGGGAMKGEGLAMGLERGVTAAAEGTIDARCGVEPAVGVDPSDNSCRKRDGVAAAAAGVAAAHAPKKLLKRSLGEPSC